MPRSKHRRKPGGKAVGSPGRRKTAAAAPWPNDPEAAAYRRFHRRLKQAFFEAVPEEEARAAHDVEFLMDTVLGATFGGTGLTARPASKAALVAELVGGPPTGIPMEDLDDGMEPYTTEMAEAGLALLAERQVVVVEGDRIALHPRLVGAGAGTAPRPEEPA